MTDKQIKQMVNRFLSWKLPEDFSPDAGIKFDPEYNVEYMAKQGKPPMRHEPTGTNLFNATQAEAMVRHMLDGLGAEKQYMPMRCDNIPVSCVDFAVVDTLTGKEVCRVWSEDDCRMLADLLNAPPISDAALSLMQPEIDRRVAEEKAKLLERLRNLPNEMAGSIAKKHFFSFEVAKLIGRDLATAFEKEQQP